MFKIGEFSKLAQVTVPTLRYYDQVGLLTPVQVDRDTGYRYYDAGQLRRLHRILALKGLGLSLDQIGTVLADGLALEEIRGMLRLRHAQISQELVERQSQLVTVEARLRQIEREEQLSPYDVMLKQVAPQLVASVRAILPSHSACYPLFVEAYEALGSQSAEALGPHPGEPGQTLVLWYDTEHKERDVDGAAAFILRCRVPDRGRMRVHELPAATMAATVHHGPYNTIGEAHEAVLTWIDANGYRVHGPDREVYLFNKAPIRQDDSSYVTEIQYPVERRAS
jgi:DNA-binding transcriptional MerR regulator/predicted transcriptional regulator YdeE